MKFSYLNKIIVCLAASLTFGLSAYAQSEVEKTVVDSVAHQDYHKGLLADLTNIRKEITLLDSATFAYKLQEEQMLYPAFDLYGDVWEDENVNPYTRLKIEVPDSFVIDVSKYAMPADYTRVNSKYGWRGRRMHNGIDLKVYTGDTLYATFSGKVRMVDYERYGYGHYVVIRHGNGLETVYGHMSKVHVKQDQILKAGDPIGLGGNTGRSTGSHLHFETRFLGIPIDPAEIFDFENRVPHTDQFTYMSAKLKLAHRMEKIRAGAAIASHKIKSGDTLSRISHLYGVSINDLCRLNNISRTTTLRLGRVIYLE